MRVHLVQFDIAWEDPSSNFARVEALIDAARVEPGGLVVLPEMFDTGFSFNIEATADRGRTLEFLRGLARRTRATIHGSRTLAGAKARNVATVVGPDGGVIAEYAKIHPFTFGREHDRFEGGESVVTYAWGPLTVCPAICYDLRFPELFRVGLRRGAGVFALGACWPKARASHWRALLIARAIENQAFVFGVNRVGADPNVMYGGCSIAVGPRGEILGELGEEPGVLSVEVDFAELEAWRRIFPAWKDARLWDRLVGEHGGARE